MKNMVVNLTKPQLENIKIFLARTSLRGEEVQAFNEIMFAIGNAKEVE